MEDRKKAISKLESTIEQLYDIRSEINKLLIEAEDTLNDLPSEYKMITARAEHYWISHIRGAMFKKHATCMTTLEETMKNLTSK
jgi:hypothetical protein